MSLMRILILMSILSACYVEDGQRGEVKAAPSFNNAMTPEEKRRNQLAQDRKDCMQRIGKDLFKSRMFREIDEDDLDSSEKTQVRTNHYRNVSRGYYDYKEYSVRGGYMRSVLAIDDDVCYCLENRQDYRVKLSEREVTSADSPGSHGKHGLLRIELTSNSNTDKKPYLEFDLDTNGISISRRHEHSCDEFVISVDHGGPQDDGSHEVGSAIGEHGRTKILLNFNAKHGNVFSSP